VNEPGRTAFLGFGACRLAVTKRKTINTEITEIAELAIDSTRRAGKRQSEDAVRSRSPIG